VLWLAGCATYGATRVDASGYHVVRRGDTLYSIAWEAGRDYHDVAAWNNLPPPYLIRPGDRLRLFPPVRGDHYVVVKGDTFSGVAGGAGVCWQELAACNRPSPPCLLRPGQRLRVAPPARAARVSPSVPALPRWRAREERARGSIA